MALLPRRSHLGTEIIAKAKRMRFDNRAFQRPQNSGDSMCFFRHAAINTNHFVSSRPLDRRPNQHQRSYCAADLFKCHV